MVQQGNNARRPAKISQLGPRGPVWGAPGSPLGEFGLAGAHYSPVGPSTILPDVFTITIPSYLLGSFYYSNNSSNNRSNNGSNNRSNNIPNNIIYNIIYGVWWVRRPWWAAGQPKFPQRGPWGPPYRAPGSKLGGFWLAGGPPWPADPPYTIYSIVYYIGYMSKQHETATRSTNPKQRSRAPVSYMTLSIDRDSTT